jgi:hypothetical protein
LNKKTTKTSTFDLQVTPNLLRDRYQIGDAAGKYPNNSQSVVQFLGEYYEQSMNLFIYIIY